MSARKLRWLLFGACVLLVPAPLVGIGVAWVPPLRMWLLGTAAAVFALSEGAEGPVGLITAVMLVQAAVYSALAWLVAWLGARTLSTPQRASARRVVLALLVVVAIGCVAFDVYVTPYGRAPRSNLIEVLS